MSKLNKAPLVGLVAMVLASSAAFARGPSPKPPTVNGSLAIDAVAKAAACTVNGGNFANGTEVTVTCGSAEIYERYVCVATYQIEKKVKGVLTVVDVVEYGPSTRVAASLEVSGVASSGANGNGPTKYTWNSGPQAGPSLEAVSSATLALDCDALDRPEEKKGNVVTPAADFSAQLCEFGVSDAAVSALGKDAAGTEVTVTGTAVGGFTPYCGGN